MSSHKCSRELTISGLIFAAKQFQRKYQFVRMHRYGPSANCLIIMKLNSPFVNVINAVTDRSSKLLAVIVGLPMPNPETNTL